MLETKINEQYQVLTPDGWSDFSDIKRKLSSNLLKIKFIDGSEITCTKDHLFEIDQHTFIHANIIKSGDVLSKKIVKDIVPIKDNQYVYDLVNVDKWGRYYTNDLVSHNCTFLGSSGTLISSAALKSMAFIRSIKKILEGLELYEEPVPGHFYILVADPSRGLGLDYAAFLVFDTSQEPFKIVAKYRNNVISPMLFPNVIVNTAKYYNDAYLVIENNDVGAQVCDLVFYELEYDNMFHGEEANGKYYLSQQGRTKQLGIKTTKRVKRQGCNALKELVENIRLIVQDFNIIEELSTFVLKRDGTYAAEEGNHDDLAMCLVLFAWLTAQQYFKDLTSFDIRQKLYEEKMRQIEEELPPLPVTIDELEDKPSYFKQDGIVWQTVLNIDDDYGKDWFGNLP